jgi:hypothetical protein
MDVPRSMPHFSSTCAGVAPRFEAMATTCDATQGAAHEKRVRDNDSDDTTPDTSQRKG